MTAIALTIAGSDSSGGAGIQADLKTFSALKVYGASIITALTAQNTQGVSAIHDVPAAFVRAQMDAVLSDIQVNAIKIGMLSSSTIIEAVAQGLEAYPNIPVILDPVMIAASGARLLDESAITSMITHLFPLANVITPNLHEAAALLGQSMARNEHEMEAQGKALLKRGARAVLMKGGHSEGDYSVDLFLEGNGVQRFAAKRIPTLNTHGTGCTLASAITAFIARGETLQSSVAHAKDYITHAIEHADTLHIGQGHGPVHHFYRLW
jgi:hydroxymethylpyrimidine/phosphomethylpyrimidine kinase